MTVRNASSVRIDWEVIPDATRYQVIYRVKGTSKWTRKASSRNFKVLRGLLSEEYQFRLRSRCPEGWTSWSPLSTFNLSIGGGSPSNEYKIKVSLDDYGSETDWELYNEDNQLLASGGPYQDGNAGTVKTSNVTLSDGCYEIDLYDSYGDGICCDYGDGKLEIFDSADNLIVSSDGIFGAYELIQFCVENGNARIINREKDAKNLARGLKSK